MCHSHESSPMLPSAAPIPPCAATVCERVGNTLESTATLKPASANCSAARRPAPPAPTTTASKLRLATATSDSPEDLHRPAGTACEPQDRRDLQREAQPGMLDVIHPDVAHADPGVDKHARDQQERREAHPPLGEQRLPPRVAHRPGPDEEEDHRVADHHQRGDALREPVLQPVMRADDDAVHHIRTAIEAVSARLTMNTAKALRLAAWRLVPMSMSRNRWRMPAHMGCRNAQMDPITRTLAVG